MTGKRKGISDVVLFIIAIAIILYTLWFILTHSTPVTLSDLIGLLGAILTFFTITLGIVISYFNDKINDVKKDIRDVNTDIKDLNKDISYIKGKMNTKNKR